MKILISLLLLGLLFSCKNSEKKSDSGSDATIASMDSITSKVFQLTDSSGNSRNEWGYDIFMHDKLYVHQPSIPAVAGNHGFSSAEEAKKVADLVTWKIRNHIMPPTVSVEELDSLNIGPDTGY